MVADHQSGTYHGGMRRMDERGNGAMPGSGRRRQAATGASEITPTPDAPGECPPTPASGQLRPRASAANPQQRRPESELLVVTSPQPDSAYIIFSSPAAWRPRGHTR